MRVVPLDEKEQIRLIAQSHPMGKMVRLPQSHIPTSINAAMNDEDIEVVFFYDENWEDNKLKELEINGLQVHVDPLNRACRLFIPMRNYTFELASTIERLRSWSGKINAESGRTNVRLCAHLLLKFGDRLFLPAQ